MPAAESATFFGFNALAGRFAGIFGLLIWSAVLYFLQDWGALRYRIGVGMLLVLVVASLFACFTIPKRRVGEVTE